ncbi:MAG: hypothetical protein GY861_20790 [bacterium]|nr:hypothetical protein [bacterium]
MKKLDLNCISEGDLFAVLSLHSWASKEIQQQIANKRPFENFDSLKSLVGGIGNQRISLLKSIFYITRGGSAEKDVLDNVIIVMQKKNFFDPKTKRRIGFIEFSIHADNYVYVGTGKTHCSGLSHIEVAVYLLDRLLDSKKVNFVGSSIIFIGGISPTKNASTGVARFLYRGIDVMCSPSSDPEYMERLEKIKPKKYVARKKKSIQRNVSPDTIIGVEFSRQPSQRRWVVREQLKPNGVINEVIIPYYDGEEHHPENRCNFQEAVMYYLLGNYKKHLKVHTVFQVKGDGRNFWYPSKDNQVFRILFGNSKSFGVNEK